MYEWLTATSNTGRVLQFTGYASTVHIFGFILKFSLIYYFVGARWLTAKRWAFFLLVRHPGFAAFLWLLFQFCSSMFRYGTMHKENLDNTIYRLCCAPLSLRPPFKCLIIMHLNYYIVCCGLMNVFKGCGIMYCLIIKKNFSFSISLSFGWCLWWCWWSRTKAVSSETSFNFIRINDFFVICRRCRVLSAKRRGVWCDKYSKVKMYFKTVEYYFHRHTFLPLSLSSLFRFCIIYCLCLSQISQAPSTASISCCLWSFCKMQ